MQKIIWQPHEGQQTLALSLDVFELLYGGARGGGKTDAGIAWLMRDIENPLYRALVLRRNADDLKDWADRAQRMYVYAEKVGQPAEFRFPSGAIIRLGHLNDENAYTKYQGHEYHRVLIEEVTQIPSEDAYEKVLASCRSSVPGLKPRVFCTTNPDGPGRNWVKRRFIDPARPNSVFIDPLSKRTRVFIPAKVEDNPTLMRVDPDYVRMLEGIKDPELRKAWRDGDWDSFSVRGAIYADLINQMRREGRIREVLYDKMIPVHTFWDLGMDDSTAIIFAQIANAEFRIIDYVEDSGKSIDEYLKMLRDKPYMYGTHYFPHDVEVKEMSTGKSRLEFIKSLTRDSVSVVPKLPIQDGINAARMRLPSCYIDQGKCETLITALDSYRREFDALRQTWSLQPVHDWSSHAADAFRYFAVSTPSNVRMGAFIQQRINNVHRDRSKNSFS